MLYVDAAVSPSGAGLIYVTSTARILYAMSEIGYVPLFYLLKQTKISGCGYSCEFCTRNVFVFTVARMASNGQFFSIRMVISYAMGPIALLAFAA